LLGRAAGSDEVAYWNHVLATLGDTPAGRAALVGQIEASAEYRRDEVDGL